MCVDDVEDILLSQPLTANVSVTLPSAHYTIREVQEHLIGQTDKVTEIDVCLFVLFDV